jgi:hypothetical protein
MGRRPLGRTVKSARIGRSGETKHYLTGIDWVLQVFDSMNVRATGAGHMFQIVMELDGVLADGDFRQAVGHFVGKFPLLNGRTRRDWNLAPYWKMASQAGKAPLALKVHHLENEEDVFPLLEEGANAAFGSKCEHLVFHLINTADKSHVAVTFDHCLFDAHGAEAFLGMFQEDWEKGGGCRWEAPDREPAHLDHWRRKFEAGKHVNRAFLRLAENAPPRALRSDRGIDGRGFDFDVISFSEQQSREIMEQADREAGYLMAMPYTLAIAVQTLHEIFVSRGVEGRDYLVPVTVDNRASRGATEEVFFNHVSFFLFRIETREVEDFSALLGTIKRQMYEQVKAGLGRDLWEASFLMRIAPPSLLSWLMRARFKGEIASFCFSFVGESGRMPTRFMGKRVHRSYHMPTVPIPPGLGVFFQQSQGRLNLNLSHARGLLSREEVGRIVGSLKSRLLG